MYTYNPFAHAHAHTTQAGPHALGAPSQLPAADWSVLPPLTEAPYPPLHDNGMFEELLQSSAVTQSTAAAHGQASRQAKLAKASSLTNWLHKLKQQG